MTGRRRRWSWPTAPSVREWLILTALAALATTLLDGVLVERKVGLFRGGFLAENFLRSTAQKALFVGASVAVDAAVLGVVAVFWLLVAMRLGLRVRGRVVLTLGGVLVPIAWADFVRYELATYLGDLLNVGVLFDLAGRSIREMLALSWPLFVAPVAALAIGVVGTFVLAWLVERIVPSERPNERRSWRPVAKAATVLFIVGCTVSAAARVADVSVEIGSAWKPTGSVTGRLVQAITDVDRDGYGLLSRPLDSNPWDASVHPYALDLPGNGIDENGVGGDLPAGEPYVEAAAVPVRWDATRPVVFVVLETFRADLLRATWHGRPVTPTLNGIADRGVSVSRAFSHNGYTVQSRYHLFTGSLTGARGATSLIDDFKQNGFETAFFSAQDESFGHWLDVGFDRADVSYDARQDVDRRFSQFTSPGSLGVPAPVLLERLEAFLRGRDKGRPLFLHLNFQDAHFPYWYKGMPAFLNDTVVSRSQMQPANAEALRAMYANTAANVDAALGRALALVHETTGQAPAVVVLADHGESLFDEGFVGHGYAVNDVQTRIPLVVANLPARVPEPFGQVDLRDVVRDAMVRLGAGDDRAPVVVPDEHRSVLQYVGMLSAPRQVAQVFRGGRVAYHFHTDAVRFDTGPWLPMSALDPQQHARAVALIQMWERVQLSQGRHEAGREPLGLGQR